MARRTRKIREEFDGGRNLMKVPGRKREARAGVGLFPEEKAAIRAVADSMGSEGWSVSKTLMWAIYQQWHLPVQAPVNGKKRGGK